MVSDWMWLCFAGKSASVSHSRTSSLALDIMSPWSSRANRDRNRDTHKDREKDKDKTKPVTTAATAVGKENAVSSSSRREKDAQARPGHARSQSQPRLQLAAEGSSLFRCLKG